MLEMIYGIGTDLTDVARLKDQIRKDRKFPSTFLTPKESEYCLSKASWVQNMAGRFAAKEAFFKALGTGWRNGMKFTDIEIVNDEFGKPIIELYGKTLKFCDQENITTTHVSISHLKEYATAIVVLERNG
jgi:holo-[acyl-carrier protein] synthase